MSFCCKRQLVTLFATVAFYLIAGGSASFTQEKNPGETQDDVIRIKTELVQTEVMIFDRQGRFVEGLRPEQFELTFNGAKRPLSFFELITSGSAREAEQVAASRGLAPKEKPEAGRPPSVVTDRGRLLFFFLDDVHLSPASMSRARTALQKFVDEEMNANDQVAIVTTSGEIGILQQLTDNSAVLHAAISRLSSKIVPDADTGKTQISEFVASQVLDYGNRELYAYLLESTKVEMQTGPGNRHGDHRLAASYSSAPYLRNRLRQVSNQARMATDATLDALESLMISSGDLPGRKVVFFLSDGFTVNERKAGALERLKQITQEAAHAGVIVYTMDARGTVFNLGSGVDASTNDYVDPSARRAGMSFGEITATREGLKIMADETGGRAFFNSNSIDDGIRQAVSETSKYYLLAWRPDSSEDWDRKSRLQVTIKDRPELTVRMRSNFAAASRDAEAISKTNGKASDPASPDDELRTAMEAVYSQKFLPVSLAVGYIDSVDAGELLKISMQIERQFLNLNTEVQPEKSEVDVIGLAIDDHGQFASFKQLVTVGATPGGEQTVVWNQQLSVKPGIYQVRVAVRERSTGRLGSASQWIEIPDTSGGKLALSSLFLAERKTDNVAATGPVPLTVDVDHRFARGSVLRFQTYVYNGSGKAEPDVWIHAQVLRNRAQVMNVAESKVPKTSDNTARMPYWAEIPLASLAPGQYVLMISATDRNGNRSASQRVKFSIE